MGGRGSRSRRPHLPDPPATSLWPSRTSSLVPVGSWSWAARRAQAANVRRRGIPPTGLRGRTPSRTSAATPPARLSGGVRATSLPAGYRARMVTPGRSSGRHRMAGRGRPRRIQRSSTTLDRHRIWPRLSGTSSPSGIHPTRGWWTNPPYGPPGMRSRGCARPNLVSWRPSRRFLNRRPGKRSWAASPSAG